MSASWEVGLYQAVRQNDVAAVDRILAAASGSGNRDVTRKEWSGSLGSPLHLAVKKESENLVRALVLGGVQVNCRSANAGLRCTALHLAAAKNLSSMVRLLLELGADLTPRGESGDLFGTPLEWAVSGGQDGSVRILLLEGSPVDHVTQLENGDSVTPLLLAVKENRVSTAHILLELEASLLAEGRLGRDFCGTALHWASANKEKGSVQMVQALVDAGADVNRVCEAGWTPLHVAAAKDMGCIVAKLLALGANAGLRAERGDLSGTPLDWAKQSDSQEAVEAILDHQPITVGDLHQLPLLEKDFAAALNVQQKIAAKMLEVEEAETKIAELLSTTTRLNVDMCTLRRQPTYKTERELKRLRRQMARLKKAAGTLQPVVFQDARSCPICVQQANMVFSCGQCDNWFCMSCRWKSTRCPNCRMDFGINPPRRNKTVERLLGMI